MEQVLLPITIQLVCEIQTKVVKKIKKFFKRSDDEFIFYEPVRFTQCKDDQAANTTANSTRNTPPSCIDVDPILHNDASTSSLLQYDHQLTERKMMSKLGRKSIRPTRFPQDCHGNIISLYKQCPCTCLHCNNYCKILNLWR